MSKEISATIEAGAITAPPSPSCVAIEIGAAHRTYDVASAGECTKR